MVLVSVATFGAGVQGCSCWFSAQPSVTGPHVGVLLCLLSFVDSWSLLARAWRRALAVVRSRYLLCVKLHCIVLYCCTKRLRPRCNEEQTTSLAWAGQKCTANAVCSSSLKSKPQESSPAWTRQECIVIVIAMYITYIYVLMYMYICICIYTFVCRYMYIQFLCIYVHIYVYTYIHF